MNYFPHTDKDIAEMLDFIGAGSLEDLFAGIPEEIRFKGELSLPDSSPEMLLKKQFRNLAEKNKNYDRMFLGGGCYRHFIPAAVKTITSRSEFYTAYTPYQAEASQGTLQAIYEFQSYMCLLNGMDVSNASLYDGATALCEAVIIAVNETKRSKILISEALHPEYRDVLHTYFSGSCGITIETIPTNEGITGLDAVNRLVDRDTAAVIIQNPNFFGIIENLGQLSEPVKAVGSLLIAAVNEPYSLGLLKGPGACGADIAAGEAQSFGSPAAFGGPGLGFIAAKSRFMRKIPGRLCGKTVDGDGNTGYVLTLQAREQHIRREKASSNICSNQALCALAATVHLSLLGREGLREAAEINIRNAHYAAELIGRTPGYGLRFQNSPFFNEVVVRCEKADPETVNRKLQEEGISGGLEMGKFHPALSDCLMFCFTETSDKADIDDLAEKLREVSEGETNSYE